MQTIVRLSRLVTIGDVRYRLTSAMFALPGPPTPGMTFMGVTDSPAISNLTAKSIVWRVDEQFYDIGMPEAELRPHVSLEDIMKAYGKGWTNSGPVPTLGAIVEREIQLGWPSRIE